MRELRLKTAAVLAISGLILGCPMMVPPGDGSSNGEPNANTGQPLQPDTVLTTGDVESIAEKIAAKFALQRVYGDGSAGSRTVSGDIRLGDQGGTNTQYVDFVVEEGVVLTVQSGTVIRCFGRFENHGTIVVQTGAEGGARSGIDSSTIFATQRAAETGAGTQAAASGEAGLGTGEQSGGFPGVGLSEFESRQLLLPGVRAGGSGGAALAEGGDGGGSFVVIAQDEIVNDGLIFADGESATSGNGGGGGGVVVLASRGSVTNTSEGGISALGGDGGGSTGEAGPGGGGGGGIVHMLAPEITDDGVVVVDGGAAGATGSAGSVTASIRSGGGGGGATGGHGGAGGGVGSSSVDTPGDAERGNAGFLLKSEVDPTALL
jgi:hypothetical protein